MMFILVVAPMRAVGVSRALMEVEHRVSAVNGFFAREFGADCTEKRDREWPTISDFPARDFLDWWSPTAFSRETTNASAKARRRPPSGVPFQVRSIPTRVGFFRRARRDGASKSTPRYRRGRERAPPRGECQVRERDAGRGTSDARDRAPDETPAASKKPLLEEKRKKDARRVSRRFAIRPLPRLTESFLSLSLRAP